MANFNFVAGRTHIFFKKRIVEFPFQNTFRMPNDLSYSIRFPGKLRVYSNPLLPGARNWQTNQLFGTDAFEGRFPDEQDGGPPSYHAEGFLAIQNAIARAFINQSRSTPNADDTVPTIMVNRFPYPEESLNIFIRNLQLVMALIFLMSLNYTFMNAVRFISIEKEKQLKEAMKIMGLPNWLHWTSWFVRTMAFMIVSISFIVALLKVSFFTIFFLCRFFATKCAYNAMNHYL